MKIYDEISPLGNSKDFVDHIFRIFDKDASGSIDFIEFMMATDMTASGTPEEKLRWAFKVGVWKGLFFVKPFTSSSDAFTFRFSFFAYEWDKRRLAIESVMHILYEKILEILDFVLYSILKLSRFQNNSLNHNQHFSTKFL